MLGVELCLVGGLCLFALCQGAGCLIAECRVPVKRVGQTSPPQIHHHQRSMGRRRRELKPLETLPVSVVTESCAQELSGRVVRRSGEAELWVSGLRWRSLSRQPVTQFPARLYVLLGAFVRSPRLLCE